MIEYLPITSTRLGKLTDTDFRKATLGPSSAEQQRAARFAAMRRELSEPPPVLRLTGMATVFDQIADLHGAGLTEYGVECFAERSNTTLLLGHNFSAPLSSAQAVHLTKSSRGLYLSCDVHADRYGLALVEAYQAGFRSLSVGTNVEGSVRFSVKGQPAQLVTRARVAEVSLVKAGAFKGTQATLKPVAMQSLSEALATLKREARAFA